jgi:hypothetical protein
VMDLCQVVVAELRVRGYIHVASAQAISWFGEERAEKAQRGWRDKRRAQKPQGFRTVFLSQHLNRTRDWRGIRPISRVELARRLKRLVFQYTIRQPGLTRCTIQWSCRSQ